MDKYIAEATQGLRGILDIPNLMECPNRDRMARGCFAIRFILLNRFKNDDGKYVLPNRMIGEIYNYKTNRSHKVILNCSNCICRKSDDNVFYCDYHERYEISDHDYIEIRDNVICRESEGEAFEFCKNCGEPVFKTLIKDGVCIDCADTIKIHEYHNFKDLKFLGDTNDGVFYGMEIETSYDKDDKMFKYAESSFDFRKIIPKNDIVDNISHYEEDGSITGIECITQPMSYEFMSNNIHHILNHLKDNDFYTRENNGIHVHVTRTEKTERLLPRILYFLENNKNDTIRFSGRESYELENWASFYTYNSSLSLNKCIDILEEKSSRYRIINNTNKNTIEFRLFRSSLDIKLVLGIIEFISVLFNLAENDDLNNDFNSIKKYAIENNYDNLLYRIKYYNI